LGIEKRLQCGSDIPLILHDQDTHARKKLGTASCPLVSGRYGIDPGRRRAPHSIWGSSVERFVHLFTRRDAVLDDLRTNSSNRIVHALQMSPSRGGFR